MTDPYQILGVSKDATLEDIKASYRKLAKKHHPDLNPGNKESEKKFKEISNAYDLVGTKEARGKFDRQETDEQKRDMYEEYVKQQGQGRRRPSYQESQQGGGRYSSSFGEGVDEEDLFSQLFGNARQRTSTKSQDELYQMEIDFLESVLGTEKTITLPTGKKVSVKIPAGIEEGKKLKFKGLGVSGDVYVQVSIKPSIVFKREGNDIISEVPISYYEAINGGEVEVPTIDGKVMLKIPSGVSSDAKLRIKNKGVGTGESRGNHIVVLKVVMPKNPSPELKLKIAELAKEFSYNPRESV